MNDLNLQCQCGKVQGTAHNVTPSTGNHLVCYCQDCQAFARHLGTAGILDEHGGTEVFQMSYADIEITQGTENLRSIKLTPKGLIRWYADCCKTPIGNTMSAKFPFVGLIHTFMHDADKDLKLGPVRAYTSIKKDSPIAHSNTPLYKIIPRMIVKSLVWKIRDSKKRNSFFKVDGIPVSEPKVLTVE